jgi:outer membrane protein assembly factor BamB
VEEPEVTIKRKNTWDGRGCGWGVAVGMALWAAALALAAPAVRADGEWLQWGGPNRDFMIERAAPLSTSWSENGPKTLWKRALGDGYSGILVDGDRLYTMHRREGDDVVVCLAAATGETLWQTPYPAPPLQKQIVDFGPGPHSTPLIVGDRIFTVSTTAILNCLDKRDGKVLWTHNFPTELGADKLPDRGYGSSPLAYRHLVIVTLGGQGKAVVALEQDSGKIAWQSQDFASSYPSPIVVRLAGEEQLLVVMDHHVAGLDPMTGTLKWKHELPESAEAIMSTPLFGEDNLLVTSGAYQDGARVLKLNVAEGQVKPEELWFSRRLRVQHGSFVRVKDRLYGSSGDFSSTLVIALDVKTGNRLWYERGFSKANVLYAGGMLVILDEEGNLALATPEADKLSVHCRAKLLEHQAWTAPTLVGTKMYLRDRKSILALDLG